MSLYVDAPGLGNKLREARLRRQMSIEQFAKLISWPPELLRTYEAGLASSNSGGSCLLGQSNEPFNVNLLLALEDDGETDLFNIDLKQAQAKAYEIIYDRRLTKSLDVMRDVLRQVSREYELAGSERSSAALAFRQQRASLEITEDRVRDMVAAAQRRLGA